jgi:peptide methionine sulfoxide reductase MsrA
VAEDTIADVNTSDLGPSKVVTEVAPAGPSWEAEPEHQDYLQQYPDGTPATSSGPAGRCLTAHSRPMPNARSDPITEHCRRSPR